MKNLIILFGIASLFYFLFLKNNNIDCDYIYTVKNEEYRGLVIKKFVIRDADAYELKTNKGIKKIYGVNKEVDDYLKEGDSLQKIKGSNKCMVIRNGQTKTFQKYLDFVHEDYCDSIKNIKK